MLGIVADYASSSESDSEDDSKQPSKRARTMVALPSPPSEPVPGQLPRHRLCRAAERVGTGAETSNQIPPWKRRFAHVDGNWPSHVFVSVSAATKGLKCRACAAISLAADALRALEESAHTGTRWTSQSKPSGGDEDSLRSAVVGIVSGKKAGGNCRRSLRSPSLHEIVLPTHPSFGEVLTATGEADASGTDGQGKVRLCAQERTHTAMLDADASDSLHLSLSRPFVLTFPQIELFLQALRDTLRWQRAFHVTLRPPPAGALAEVLLLTNEARSRTFVALPVSALCDIGDKASASKDDGCSTLHSLIKCVDTVLQRLELGLGHFSYFREPVLHLTVGTTVGDALFRAPSGVLRLQQGVSPVTNIGCDAGCNQVALLGPLLAADGGGLRRTLVLRPASHIDAQNAQPSAPLAPSAAIVQLKVHEVVCKFGFRRHVVPLCL